MTYEWSTAPQVTLTLPQPLSLTLPLPRPLPRPLPLLLPLPSPQLNLSNANITGGGGPWRRSLFLLPYALQLSAGAYRLTLTILDSARL